MAELLKHVSEGKDFSPLQRESFSCVTRLAAARGAPQTEDSLPVSRGLRRCPAAAPDLVYSKLSSHVWA